MRQAKSAVAPAWLQPATDYVPLGLFLLAYLLADILVATGVLVVATLAATALSLAVARRLPLLALIAAAVVSIFGVLTLVFQDDLFIKIKPTVMQLLFAAALWISLWMRRPVLRLARPSRCASRPGPASPIASRSSSSSWRSPMRSYGVRSQLTFGLPSIPSGR